MNTLYFGDNLQILKDNFDSESVDLIYLDPPFNSKRDYNVLFREQSGNESPAQIKAFGDTWNWAGAAEAWADFMYLCPVPKLYELMQGFKNAIGENDVLAYLVMMAPRLYQLSRVLKPTGSIYLHCDPTASHYLKLVMDCLFGAKNFKNEIIWKRTSAHSSAKRYGSVHDTILFYTKSASFTWNNVYQPYDEDYLTTFFDQVDEQGKRWKRTDLTGAGTTNGESGQEWRGINVTAKGRHWAQVPSKLEELDKQGRIHWPLKEGGMPRLKQYPEDLPGVPLQDVWNDIRPMHNLSAERLGYPTQKPLTLLERILAASSNLGDVVLDPFCGCGTAIIAAEKLRREWRGIDITPIATSLVQMRLLASFGARDVRLVEKGASAERVFKVECLPTDIHGAREMYAKDPLHKDFEMWAVGLIPAYPQESKGADSGIDGLAYFDEKQKKLTKAVVQVKGGHVMANHIRDLRGVMARDSAKMGFFVTLEPPTKPMRDEALNAGFYQPESGFGKRVHALQIRTIQELLDGKEFDVPIYGSNVTFKQAGVVRDGGVQAKMDLLTE